MDRYLNRKSLVTALGVAWLGLGGIVAAASAPLVLAQEASTPALAQDEATPAEAGVRERFRSGGDAGGALRGVHRGAGR